MAKSTIGLEITCPMANPDGEIPRPAAVHAVGIALYTYEALEPHVANLWEWFEAVERWTGHEMAEYGFEPVAKPSRRIWKASAANRAKLRARLKAEQPWSVLGFGWPNYRQHVRQNRGYGLGILARRQETPELAWLRSPSIIYLIVHTDVLTTSVGGIEGLLDLGVRLWQDIGAVYGFIDVETGLGLQDDLLRNAIQMVHNLVAPEHVQELREWQRLHGVLDRRVWRPFWGNFLGPTHMEGMGRVAGAGEAQQGSAASAKEQAFARGVEHLRASGGFQSWRELARGGALLTMSSSPLEWSQPDVQERCARLQEAFGQMALGPWDWCPPK